MCIVPKNNCIGNFIAEVIRGKTLACFGKSLDNCRVVKRISMAEVWDYQTHALNQYILFLYSSTEDYAQTNQGHRFVNFVQHHLDN